MARPLCGVLPAGRKRHSFSKASCWRRLPPAEGDSPSPEATCRLAREPQVAELVITEHRAGFPLSQKVRWGSQGLPQDQGENSCQRLFVGAQVGQICVKQAQGCFYLHF